MALNVQVKPQNGLPDAGVKVKLKSYEGVTHEFLGMGAVVDKAKEAQGVVAADLKAAFGM